MNEPFKPGHLKRYYPVLVQTPSAKRNLSKRNHQRNSLDKLKPIELNWKRKEG